MEGYASSSIKAKYSPLACSRAKSLFLPGAISPVSIKRLKDGRLFALWNPIPVYNGRSENVDGVWTGARTPLAAAFSDNDGKSFGELHIIENDERRGYAYTAIHELENGDVLLAYCAGGVEDKCMLNRLRITKLKFEE